MTTDGMQPASLLGEIPEPTWSARDLEYAMGVFTRKPDAMTVTLKIVQALMDGDQGRVRLAAAEAARLSTADIFASIGTFYQTLASGITAEQKQAMRQEIAATTGPPEVVRAVQEICLPLFVDSDGRAAVTAINLHGSALEARPDNAWSGVIMESLDLAARINTRLGIKLRWS